MPRLTLELRKLEHSVNPNTLRNVLAGHLLGPMPKDEPPRRLDKSPTLKAAFANLQNPAVVERRDYNFLYNQSLYEHLGDFTRFPKPLFKFALALGRKFRAAGVPLYPVASYRPRKVQTPLENARGASCVRFEVWGRDDVSDLERMFIAEVAYSVAATLQIEIDWEGHDDGGDLTTFRLNPETEPEP